MPVFADFTWYKAATMATSLSTTDIGGARSGTAVTTELLGDVFFRMTSPASGAGVLRQHQKLFLYLSAGADGPLKDAKVWIENALDSLGANSKLRGTWTSGDTTRKVRAVGKNAAGVATIEEKTGPAAAGDVDWSTDWARIDRAESRLVSSGAYSAFTTAVTLKVEPSASPGSGYATLGTIPANKRGASAEFKVWAEATLDTSTTNGTGNDCTVAPGGSSFSKPRVATSGLTVANSGQIDADTAAPIWVLWELQEEAKGSGEILCCLRVTGGT